MVRVSFFLLLLAVALGWVAFGERGLIHLYRMEGKREEYKERINRLEEKNRRLLQEIELLKKDRSYVETVARRELNLLKENEVHYHFEPEADSGVTKGSGLKY